MKSYFGKLSWAIRYVGYVDAGLICLAKLCQIATNRFIDGEWFWYFTERRFDKRLGVQTVDMVPVEQLDITDEQRRGGIRYEPTPFMEFGYVFSRLPITHDKYSFVDLGSGKGRAILMATKFLFRRVMGVEFSRELHQIAQDNLEHCCRHTQQGREIRSVCADATTFEFADEPFSLGLCIVY